MGSFLVQRCFACLQFGFVILGQKEIVAKAAQKMLVKLTTGREGTHLHRKHIIRIYQNQF